MPGNSVSIGKEECRWLGARKEPRSKAASAKGIIYIYGDVQEAMVEELMEEEGME